MLPPLLLLLLLLATASQNSGDRSTIKRRTTGGDETTTTTTPNFIEIPAVEPCAAVCATEGPDELTVFETNAAAAAHGCVLLFMLEFRHCGN